LFSSGKLEEKTQVPQFIIIAQCFSHAFLLDEFAALGRLEAVERAMGLMAGYGLQLRPILQDMSQLKDLYGDPDHPELPALSDKELRETLDLMATAVASMSNRIDGLVPVAFRSLDSFRQPFVRRPRGFCRPAMNAAAVGYRTR
jgi:hypothetical protein